MSFCVILVKNYSLCSVMKQKQGMLGSFVPVEKLIEIVCKL